MSFTCFGTNSCNCLLVCVIYVRTCNCYVWNYYHCLMEKKHTFSGMLSIWGYISNKSRDNFFALRHEAQALWWQLLTGMVVVCWIKNFFVICLPVHMCVEWVGEWVSEWVSEWVREWVSGRRTDGWTTLLHNIINQANYLWHLALVLALNQVYCSSNVTKF